MRFVVVGTSGSGKTTFARALASVLSLPYVELDGLFWLPNWTECPVDDFRAQVVAETAGPHWVADGNYSVVRDVLWARATHLIWLNYSRFTTYSRIIRRTLTRTITGQRLWSGNRETFHRSFLSRDSVLLWSFTSFGPNRREFGALRTANTFSHLTWHEFRSPTDAREFLFACAVA